MTITFNCRNHSYKIPSGAKKVLRENLVKARLPMGVDWQVRPITGVRANAQTPSFSVKGITRTNLVSVVLKPKGNDSAMEYHIVPPDGFSAQEIAEKLQISKTCVEPSKNGKAKVVEMKQRTGQEALSLMGVSASSKGAGAPAKNKKSSDAVRNTRFQLSERSEDAQLCVLAFTEAFKEGWFQWEEAREIIKGLFSGMPNRSYGKAIVSLVERYGFCEYEGGEKGESESRPRLRVTLKGQEILGKDSSVSPSLPANAKKPHVEIPASLGRKDPMAGALKELKKKLSDCDKQIEALQQQREKVARAIASLEEI